MRVVVVVVLTPQELLEQEELVAAEMVEMEQMPHQVELLVLVAVVAVLLTIKLVVRADQALFFSNTQYLYLP
jgi:hypothetical protein